MRPDRRDFAAPGDIIIVIHRINPIVTLTFCEGYWTWTRTSESDVFVERLGLGLVVGTSPTGMDVHDEDDNLIESGLARYIVFPNQVGWLLHDEVRLEERLVSET